jgi:hypothetical protein
MARRKRPARAARPGVLPHGPERRSDSLLISSIAVILMLLFVLQCAASMVRQSATYDEPVYIAAGYSYVQAGDFRLKRDAPPLVSTLSGLALTLGTHFGNDVWFDGTSPLWNGRTEYRFAAQFLARAQDRYRTLQIARIPVVLIGATLALYLFRFGRLLLGGEAALLPLFLFCLDPNMIAHARIVSDDAALAAFFFISHYYLYRLFTGNRRADIAGFAVAVALTTTAKFSGLLVFPSAILVAGIFYLFPAAAPLVPHGGTAREQRQRLLRVGGLAAVACIAATLVLVSIVYRSPDGISQYAAGVRSIYTNGTAGFKFYLLGQFETTASWYYYPVAMFLKTPDATLALFAVAVASVLVPGARGARGAWLLAPVALVLAVSSQDPVTLGLRRVLLVFPFLFLWIGQRCAALWELVSRAPLGRRIARVAVAVVIAAGAFSAIRIHPYQLAYFNRWAGGPAAGSRYLDDSNIDWGQDLPALAAWQTAHGARPLALWYFGTDDPAGYGIDSRTISEQELAQPEKAAYAISETLLVGLKLRAQEERRPDLDWLARYQPSATAGYSIYIYDFRTGP